MYKKLEHIKKMLQDDMQTKIEIVQEEYKKKMQDVTI